MDTNNREVAILKLIDIIETWAHNDMDRRHIDNPNITRRWLFCYDNREGLEKDYAWDCACVIMKHENGWNECDCICHERIRNLAEKLYMEIYE